MLRDESSFVSATISGGSFNSNNQFVGSAISLPEIFVLGLRGSSNAGVLVEITDTSQNTVSYDLRTLPIDQNFRLDLSAGRVPVGFNRNQVAQINLINNRSNSPESGMDLIQVHLKGLEIAKPEIPQELADLRNDLIARGVEYFKIGNGIDPTKHYPYDNSNADGTFETGQKFTQLTLVGFYAQILADAVSGTLDNGNTVNENLVEIANVVNNLLADQAAFGWKGLLPAFIGLVPALEPKEIVAVGDNANLVLSLVTMVGALENANLTSSQRDVVATITSKVEQFIDNQEQGYVSFIHPTFGILQADINRNTNLETCVNSNTCAFHGFLDRLNTEFRAPLIYLVSRFDSIPETVLTNMEKVLSTYTSSDGTQYDGLVSFEGGAFQTTWNLRAPENNFSGFKAIQRNHYLIQLSYAHDNNLPGILSASGVPNQDYEGQIGLPTFSENGENTNLYTGAGSTYALASAYSVDPVATLTWLKAIEDQVPSIRGPYGFLDSATSNTEVAQAYFGVDVGSTVLGLADTSSQSLITYLKNRDKELDFNLLYEQLNIIGIERSPHEASLPPVFPNRTLSVFNVFDSEGVINSFLPVETTLRGVRLAYNNLVDGFGGKFWSLNSPYDARSNELRLTYSSKQSLPDKIKIELKDSSDQILFTTSQELLPNSFYSQIRIDLPDDAELESVSKVVVLAEDEDGGDFYVHGVDFRHFS